MRHTVHNFRRRARARYGTPRTSVYVGDVPYGTVPDNSSNWSGSSSSYFRTDTLVRWRIDDKFATEYVSLPHEGNPPRSVSLVIDDNESVKNSNPAGKTLESDERTPRSMSTKWTAAAHVTARLTC